MKRSFSFCMLLLTMSFPAVAQSPMTDEWRFQAIVYAYLPSIGGKTSFPVGSGSSINVDAGKIIDSLKFTMMGTLEGQKGRYGFLTDLIYLNVGGSASRTRDFSVNGHELPAAASVDANLDLQGLVWTLAGTYRPAAASNFTVDVLAGARLLDLKETLDYSLNVDVGPIVGPGRTGTSEARLSYWDAIVGAKGRFMFGANHEWFVPWYADVGTGQSDLTWQAVGGLGYSFSWGQVIGTWRYLDYNFKSGAKIESLNFSGPMLGVAFNW